MNMRELMEAVKSEAFGPGENGYVSVKLHKDDAKDIKKHLTNIGIKGCIAPSDLHCTLFYCPDGMEVMDHNPKTTYTAQCTGRYEILGNPPWKALVLHLKSPELVKRHNEIKSSGYEHSHPSFKLHLSLKYDATDKDLELIKENPISLETLRFDNEHWENIK